MAYSPSVPSTLAHIGPTEKPFHVGSSPDARDATHDTPVDAGGSDRGLDAASDRSLVDDGAPDAKETSSGEAHGTVDSGASDSGSLCSEAPCLASLFLPCQPSGTCTSEDTTGTGAISTSDYCYSNGVKQRIVSDIAANNMVATNTAKRDTGVCYVIEATMSLAIDPIRVS